MTDLNIRFKVNEQIGEDVGLLKTNHSEGKEKRMRWRRTRSRRGKKEKKHLLNACCVLKPKRTLSFIFSNLVITDKETEA